MRILLIEDDISLCNALMIHLRSEGYETDVCHNGTDGLSYALQNTYDGIILDRMLPELDGLTLLSAIRRKNIFTPVIIATAMDSLQEKINGLDCGADDYITKPFDAQELLARIRALSRRPAVMETCLSIRKNRNSPYRTRHCPCPKKKPVSWNIC